MKKVLLTILISMAFFLGITYIYAQEENITEGEGKSQEVVTSDDNQAIVPEVTVGESSTDENDNQDIVATEPADTPSSDITSSEVAADVTGNETGTTRDATPATYHHDYTIVSGEGSGVTLTTILETISVELNLEDIESVVPSDPNIISVTQSGSDYNISSPSVFNTQETLTITLLDGTKYIIRLTDSTTPNHEKNIYDNGDGTYIIELTVTGDATNEQQQTGNVDFVLVYDLSQSMTSNAGNTNHSRADQAEDVIHDFLTNLATYQKGDNIRVSLVTFGKSAEIAQNWTTNVTGLANRFDDGGTDGRTNFTYNSYGTNWDYALQLALSLINNSRTGVPTFVLFLTDGAPTATGRNGDDAIAPTGASIGQLRERYNAATSESNQIYQNVSSKDGLFYGIYAYGTEADLLDDLMYYSVNGQHRNGSINNVVAATQTAPNYSNAGNTAAVQEALDKVFDKLVQALGISSATISDGTTNNVQTSTGGIAELLEVDEDSYEYWISIPVVNNTFERVDRNGNTVTYTVNCEGSNCTVTWGSKTETVQGTLTSREFKYQWTEANNLYDYDAPEAVFEDGAVTWNLSSVGTLLDGVTYSVTFRVYPSQETLDYIADIKNNPGEEGAWADLDPVIQEYIDYNGNLKTNTTATLTYVDTRTDEPGEATFLNPDPVPTTAVEAIAITKTWENNIDGRTQSPVTLTVTRDGVDTYTVRLDDDNDWTSTVFVSIGIIDKDGNVLSGSEGHDFTFTEPEDLSYHWELDVPVVHPMLINGVVTMLIKVDAKHPAPEGATIYTINGAEYYVDEAAVALTATNDRRSRVYLTKEVIGDDAPENTLFTFTINVVNSKAPESEPTDDPDHESDYWIWISVRDAEGNGVTSGVTGATSNNDGWWYAPSGTDITVPVMVGYSILINNLPTGSTYTITEGTMPTGYRYNTTNLTIEGDGTDSTFTGGLSTTGTIESTNTKYNVAYTNEYVLVNINVDKVWDDNSDQDGIRPDDLELSLNGAPSDVVVSDPTITVSEDGNTWTYTWTGLPKYDANGEEIEYTVTEGTVPSGYTCEETTAEDGGTITNVHVPAVVNVFGTKTWVDGGATNRPSVTIVLLKEVKDAETGEVSYVTVSTQALSSNNTYKFENLPKYEDGEEIKYSVEELTLGNNYISTMVKAGTYEFNFTNTLVTNVSGTKTWLDGNNAKNTRPTSITVVLKANGQEVDRATMTSDNWSYSFTNLPAYDGETELVYTVTENPVDDYLTTYDGYNIINTLVTNVSGTKTWVDGDNTESTRPTSITVVLKANGQEVDTATMTSDNWSYSFTNLPVFDGETELVYTVTENAVSGYATTYDGYNIINTLLTNVTVTKVWNDSNNQDGIRPTSITVTLSNGTVVTLNESNEWTATVSNLPKYDTNGLIEYTWEESLPDGYTITSQETVNGITTIVNTHEVKTRDITVTKVWDDRDDYFNIRPESVTINLYANGDVIDSVELNEANKWTYTWEGLAYNDEGEEIEYTIDEDKVEGYETEITGSVDKGFTVTNFTSGTGGDDVPEGNPKTADSIYTYISMLFISLIGLLTFSYKYVKNN